MSLATNIKEFADVLHNIYAQQLSSVTGATMPSDAELTLAIPKIVVIQQACLYLVKSFGSTIIYFLSFQWLRDFSYFPLLSPESQNESSIVTDTFLSEPGSYLFSFSKSGVTLFSSTLQDENLNIGSPFSFFLKSNQLINSLGEGFVNSFFFSLPFSLPHLITLRRMFSQGAAAATASIFGTITAHSLLLVGVLYGIRFLIIPFYSLEPLTFFIGTITVAIVITDFVKEKRIYLVPLTHYPSLLRIGVLNFILALCESATVFHNLHHLTLNKQISYLQSYGSSYLPWAREHLGVPLLDSFFIHTAYLLAFVLGHALFSFFFCYLILKGNERLCSLTGWILPKTARQINKALLIVIITLTFSGFPYYGLDYLFTKSAGFLPEDPAYMNTIFSPTQLRSRTQLFKSRAPATKNAKTPLELDLNYFDRGMYLNAPKENEEKITIDPYEEKKKEDLISTSIDVHTPGDKNDEKARHSKNSSVPLLPPTDAPSYSDYSKGAQQQGLEHDKRAGRSEDKSVSSFSEKEEIFATDDPALSFDRALTFDPALTFEELNYQGEWAWVMRDERVGSIEEDENEDDSKKESIFQKPKNHFKELRLKQEIKQAQTALKESSQIGSISGWKEGSVFGEMLPFYSEDYNTNYKNQGLKDENLLKEPLFAPRRALTPKGDYSERAQATTGLANVLEDGNKGREETSNNSPEQNIDRKALLKELAFEKEIAANYEKSFVSPFGESFDGTPPALLPVENIIKNRYRVNPVYRALLQSDIDSFIARQPLDYKITQNQEANLFKKRQLLERYYNSIRYYAPIESVGFANLYDTRLKDALVTPKRGDQKGSFADQNNSSLDLHTQLTFPNESVHEIERSPYKSKTSTPFTKSFVETTYHQQFKGTLNTVKRFFKVTFDKEQNPNKNRILSYDQPLYKNPIYYPKGEKNHHPSLHEEIDLGTVSPFVEESNSAPIYAGWDDKARRFVITNRFNFVE